MPNDIITPHCSLLELQPDGCCVHASLLAATSSNAVTVATTATTDTICYCRLFGTVVGCDSLPLKHGCSETCELN